MTALLGWLAGIPLGALYGLIFLAAFVEGLVPVVPGDVTAAFLAFLAARSGGALVPTIGVVTAGSVTGAVAKWYLGRRYGAAWLAARLERFGIRTSGGGMEAAEHRVEDAYRRFGWAALFVSRLVPGVRAVVPFAAGALKIPALEVIAIFALASALWYGAIVWVAFRIGTDWATVQARLSEVLRDVGLGATGLAVVLAAVGWWWWRRRRRPR
ncbi:MAG: hypothetical protein RL139_498 [Gemmatimonadota bacterium]|jgi:membrane protein DedA with SNARE-associated domain